MTHTPPAVEGNSLRPVGPAVRLDRRPFSNDCPARLKTPNTADIRFSANRFNAEEAAAHAMQSRDELQSRLRREYFSYPRRPCAIVCFLRLFLFVHTHGLVDILASHAARAYGHEDQDLTVGRCRSHLVL